MSIDPAAAAVEPCRHRRFNSQETAARELVRLKFDHHVSYCRECGYWYWNKTKGRYGT